MKRILNIRIVKWYFKLLFVAGVWLVGFPVVAVLDEVNSPALVFSAANAVITLMGVLFGARVFRGRDEPVAPRRPWWQMTARRRLSRVLSVLLLLSAASYVLVLTTAVLGVAASVRSLESYTVAGLAIDGTLVGALAFLYLNSAIRLGKIPTAVLDRKFLLRHLVTPKSFK